jgi:serine/threonine-protein kinase
MTEDDAKDTLADTHLAVGETTLRYSETVPEGQVIATDPEPGTTLRPDAIVDLVVSKGRRPIEVGDWTGKDADRAEQVLEKKGLVVDRSQTEYSDTVAEGDVIAQTPASGTLFKGETVTLVVSDGPELIEVPGGLVASGVEAAREKLEALGFDVDIEHSRSYLGLGYVFSTDPDSGSMAPKGSTITLYII